ncbi:hypothetical protein GCM10023084_78190 [Streptomyces lacrimifluminis]|uniref:Uncharacterized protein n=1 Tax=Streptomyces lacrimifluminis TaxID=1500077 RepID=A0A917PA31_9ACTN|nr:hypothetical protein GCM10012282_76170 [Streptomyces lacrimifluminis]
MLRAELRIDLHDQVVGAGMNARDADGVGAVVDRSATQEHEDVADILRQMEPSAWARPLMRTPHRPVRTRCA